MKRDAKHVKVALRMIVTVGVVTLACTLTDQVSLGPTPLPTPPGTPSGTGAIAGRVWHDLCASPGEGQPWPPSPPEGCVEKGAGVGYEANGTLEGGEPGLSAVEVTLGQGSCPATASRRAQTGADGFYLFAGLTAGSYCVQIDPGQGDNAALLLPGVWTYPALPEREGIAFTTVTLAEGEVRSDIYFGWDYRFQPSYQPQDAQPSEALPTEASSPTPTHAPATATPSVASPTDTPTVTPSVAPGDPRAGLGEPTWRDNFQDGGDWPLYADGHVRFEVEEGSLHMTAFNADFWNGWMLRSEEVEDAYLEMKATFDECAGRDAFGIMARAQRAGGTHVGYLFGISCDGRFSLRTWDGESYSKLVDWTSSEHLFSGPQQENRLGFWMQQGQLKLYANGNLLTERSDAQYQAGQYGVFVGAAQTANLRVRVAEFAYWLLP